MHGRQKVGVPGAGALGPPAGWLLALCSLADMQLAEVPLPVPPPWPFLINLASSVPPRTVAPLRAMGATAAAAALSAPPMSPPPVGGCRPIEMPAPTTPPRMFAPMTPARWIGPALFIRVDME